jgi:hypothetical protein
MKLVKLLKPTKRALGVFGRAFCRRHGKNQTKGFFMSLMRFMTFMSYDNDTALDYDS